MAQPGAWGCELTLLGASHVMGRPVRIFTTDSHKAPHTTSVHRPIFVEAKSGGMCAEGPACSILRNLSGKKTEKTRRETTKTSAKKLGLVSASETNHGELDSWLVP